MKADVHDPDSMSSALAGSSVILSGLGIAGGDDPGALAAGARSVIAARPRLVVWLGAYGTGRSAPAAGVLTRNLLRMLGPQLADKVAADTIVLDAGGIVFHAGPLSNGALSATRRAVGLDRAPRRPFPARVSRATVAALMLDEAENPGEPGTIRIPLQR
ncbi:NAD(P)H-binding protein [Tsukamurella soli]|uniref:NAD(P)H-binding protein n=1 Tax=Tsukamurella soli TaxID=644556 RepID=UPI0036161749